MVRPRHRPTTLNFALISGCTALFNQRPSISDRQHRKYFLALPAEKPKNRWRAEAPTLLYTLGSDTRYDSGFPANAN